MSRPTVDYLNARRAAKAATGGGFAAGHRYLRDAPDYGPPEPFELELARAFAALDGFILWLQCTTNQHEVDDVPF